MKHPFTKRSATLVAAVTSLLFISAFSVRAQPRQPPPSRVPQLPTERVLAPRVETRESLQDEFDRRMNAVDNHNPVGYDDFRARRQILQMMTVAQIKKDVERIQFFNTEMAHSVASSAPLDYDQIVKATGEINKRASRLMHNLNIPKLEKSEKLQVGPELFDRPTLVVALRKLDEMVRHFGANPTPLLGNVGVLDVKAVTDARRNLADIIVLSDKIKKSARQLARTARN